MTDKNRAGFSHHEKLRYEYLLSNLQYLNAKEQAEFQQLYAKMKRFLEAREDMDDNQFLVEPKQEPEEKSTDLPVDDLPLKPYPKRRQKKREQVKSAQPARSDSDEVKPVKVKKKRAFGVKSLVKGLVVVLLLTLIGMAFMFVKGMTGFLSDDTPTEPALTEFFDGQDSPNGTNILLLGSDQRVTERSADARADTIMVLNIGGQEGKMTLVSFMRDTLVNIPDVSYADGYFDQKLNTAFAIGEQNDHQGAELMRQVLKHNFDVDIKYYMMIDFQTFATAVDSLFPNGVEIDAKFATVDGQPVSSVDVPDDLRMVDGVVPEQTIHVGLQRMDGRTLLNYARFRKDDEGDFGRTKRQQEVMGAMLSQMKDPTKLFTGSEALGKIYRLTSTNISYPDLLGQGLKSATTGLKLERATVPANGDWYDDYDAYGGQGILIDFAKYQEQLSQLGLR